MGLVLLVATVSTGPVAEVRAQTPPFTRRGPSAGHVCDSSGAPTRSSVVSEHFFIEFDAGTLGAGLTIGHYVAALEHAWTRAVDQFGWAPPPSAPTPAPGRRYHVRLVPPDPVLGGFSRVSRVGSHAGLVGDNPATPWDDHDAYATCMLLPRDMGAYTASIPLAPQAALSALAAHELGHALQEAVGANTSMRRFSGQPPHFVEGVATWFEDELVDEADNQRWLLWPDFSDDMASYGGFSYSYWLTFRGLTERFGTTEVGGSEQVVQEFYELVSREELEPIDALRRTFAARGLSLDVAFHDYAIAARFMHPCDGGHRPPHCFEEADSYVADRGLPAAHGAIAAVGSAHTGTVAANYALNWVALPASDAEYDVTVSNTSSVGELDASLACDAGGSLHLVPLGRVPAGGSATAMMAPGCTAPTTIVTNPTRSARDTTQGYRVTTVPRGPS